MSKKIAVIGLGNTLRRDDGIGIIILESLLSSYRRESLEYLNFGTASFDLIHRLDNYKKVLLIDAINAHLNPGELRIFELNKIKFSLKDAPTSSHELNLQDIFRLYKQFGIKAKVYVAGIQVKDVSFEEGLTAPVKKEVKKITEEIDNFIATTLIK